ncbi:hypothetical protein CRYUN_Cryun08bG0082500 [Craigia yunnanensis]
MMKGKLMWKRTDMVEFRWSVTVKIRNLLLRNRNSLAWARALIMIKMLMKSSQHWSKLRSLVEVTMGQVHGNDVDITNDLNTAKIAAMKAAELVNRNLIGAGHSNMTTEPKKKLLWGSKKSTPAEESGNRWDTALFGDREREDKFNKLMGVKGDVTVEHKPDNQNGSGLLVDLEKQRELQLDLEKQYTAGLRRRDGRTVGLGL